MRGVGVEEAAAVGAEHLDRFLEATGPSAIVCCAPSSVVASIEPPSVCGTPCADQEEREHDESGSST